jgi:hypothetical protein
MAQRGALDLELDAIRARLEALEAAAKRVAPKNQPKNDKKADQAKEPE